MFEKEMESSIYKFRIQTYCLFDFQDKVFLENFCIYQDASRHTLKQLTTSEKCVEIILLGILFGRHVWE